LSPTVLSQETIRRALKRLAVGWKGYDRIWWLRWAAAYPR
jgi:hypothetical protein